jgi:hypothetical protein
MANICYANYILHSGTTSVDDGTAMSIQPGMVTANVFIRGTTTSHTVVFEGKDDDGNWYLIKSCVNLSTMTIASQTSGINEVWQVDLTGWTAFRARVSAISTTGSGLTIKAKVVD